MKKNEKKKRFEARAKDILSNSKTIRKNLQAIESMHVPPDKLLDWASSLSSDETSEKTFDQ